MNILIGIFFGLFVGGVVQSIGYNSGNWEFWLLSLLYGCFSVYFLLYYSKLKAMIGKFSNKNKEYNKEYLICYSGFFIFLIILIIGFTFFEVQFSHLEDKIDFILNQIGE